MSKNWSAFSLRAGKMESDAVLESWRIALPSVRLRKKPMATRVLDHDLVLFRDEAGVTHALLDRCPHRGVRLSLGEVTDGAITCGYHGWRFESNGECAHIPSLRDDQRIPHGIRSPAFRCVDRDGYIWVWTGEPGQANAGPLPIRDVATGRWIQSTILMDCHWLKPIENNVDPTHAAFAHKWTHPQWYQRRFRGQQESQTEVRLTETGFVLWAPATQGPDDPIPESPPVKAEFDLPDRVTVSFSRPFPQVIVLHSVPTGPNSCRLEAMVKVPIPFGQRIRFSGWEHPIYKQDRVLMESAESWTREIGQDFERSVEADYSMLLVRRIVDMAAKGAWPNKCETLKERRTLSFRA